jgi:hypothetical protein
VIERRGGVNIFGDHNLHDYLNRRRTLAWNHIQSEQDDYLLNIDIESYALHVYANFAVSPVEIHFDRTSSQQNTVRITRQEMPRVRYVRHGSQPTISILTIFVPYKGEGELLSCIPNRYMECYPRIALNPSVFELDYRLDAGLPKALQEFEREKSAIKWNMESMNAQITEFNAELLATIRQSSLSRRQQLAQLQQELADAGIPLRSTTTLSGTFSIPNPTLPKRSVQSLK